MKKQIEISDDQKCFLIRFIIFAIPFNQGISYLSDLAIQYLLKDDFQLLPGQSDFIRKITMVAWMGTLINFKSNRSGDTSQTAFPYTATDANPTL